MRKHAFLNGNIVVKVESITEDQWKDEIKNYVSILDVEDEPYDIGVGWYFTHNGWTESAEYSQPVPSFVTPRQFRVALIMSGISIPDLEAVIDGLDEPTKSIAKTTWEYSTEINRQNPLLVSLVPLAGISAEQLDDLFKLAATL